MERAISGSLAKIFLPVLPETFNMDALGDWIFVVCHLLHVYMEYHVANLTAVVGSSALSTESELLVTAHMVARQGTSELV